MPSKKVNQQSDKVQPARRNVCAGNVSIPTNSSSFASKIDAAHTPSTYKFEHDDEPDRQSSGNGPYPGMVSGRMVKVADVNAIIDNARGAAGHLSFRASSTYHGPEDGQED